MLTTTHFNRKHQSISGQLFLAGLISILVSCASTKSTPPTSNIIANGKAVKTKKSFRMIYEVGISINATPKTIWAILTNAPDFHNWNTTIDSIEGNIALNEAIKLHAKIAPNRTFKMKVSEFNPSSKMVWSDGNAMFKGVRTFSLKPMGEKVTVFTMQEVYTGAMLPMIKGSLPDFTTAFETFAADLKKKAEAIE